MAKSIIEIAGAQLTLDSRKAIFWADKSVLLLSDLHIGKAGHFRKNGSPLPATAHLNDYSRLTSLIRDYHPERVIFLGDLFHSSHNMEVEGFRQFRDRFPNISFEIVPGNHDTRTHEHLAGLGLKILPEEYELFPFLFSE